MFLLAAPALAAPLAPVPVQRTGVAVSAFLAGERAWVRAEGCEGDACEAVRRELGYGARLDVAVTRNVGFWASGERLGSSLDAAGYAGDGWGLGGGLRLGAALAPETTVHGWASVGWARTEGEGEEAAERLLPEAGAAVAFGDAEQGAVAWFGASVVPWARDEATVLDGGLEIDFQPAVPGELAAGVLLVSDPLGGPWAERGRAAFGVTGTLGFRSGLAGWVTAAF